MLTNRQTFAKHPVAPLPRIKSLIYFAAMLTMPSMALARQVPSDIDTITTASIPSQAMLWRVDPSVILMLLIGAFIALSVAGFALTRRSVRDAAIQQQSQSRRSFE